MTRPWPHPGRTGKPRSKECRGLSRRACAAGTPALHIRETAQKSDSQNCLIMSWLCNYSSLFWQRAQLSFLWHNYLKLSPLVYRHVYKVGYKLFNLQNLIETMGRTAMGAAGLSITAYVRKCLDRHVFACLCRHSPVLENIRCGNRYVWECWCFLEMSYVPLCGHDWVPHHVWLNILDSFAQLVYLCVCIFGYLKGWVFLFVLVCVHARKSFRGRVRQRERT